MQTLLAALAGSSAFNLNSVGKSAGHASTAGFSKVLAAAFASGPAQDLISRLQERFPAAKVAERDVPPGLEASKAAAGSDGDTTSDKVNLSSPLLAQMTADSGLAGKIEDMLAGLLSGGAANPTGGYIQRSVTLTVTTVRYTEMRRSDENGDILAAGELQTALRDRIDEMLADLAGALEKAFGNPDRDPKNPASDAPAADDGGDGDQSLPARSQPGWASAGLWSLELFYSSITTVQSTTRSGGYGSYGGLTGDSLPSFLSGMLAGGAGAGGAGVDGVGGILERALAESAISFSGYRRVDEAFSFKFTQSRNLIEELMELYGERLGEGGGGTAADATVAEEEEAAAIA